MDGRDVAGNGTRLNVAAGVNDGAKSRPTDDWRPVSEAGNVVLGAFGASATSSDGEGIRDASDEGRSAMRYDLGTCGRIVFDGGRTDVGCIIKNLSKTGACIEVPMGVTWPQTFTLEIHDGETREVEAVWAENRIVGVRFLSDERDWSAGEGDSGRLRGHLLRSVQVLQEELDRLRRVIETKL